MRRAIGRIWALNGPIGAWAQEGSKGGYSSEGRGLLDHEGTDPQSVMTQCTPQSPIPERSRGRVNPAKSH